MKIHKEENRAEDRYLGTIGVEWRVIGKANACVLNTLIKLINWVRPHRCDLNQTRGVFESRSDVDLQRRIGCQPPALGSPKSMMEDSP